MKWKNIIQQYIFRQRYGINHKYKDGLFRLIFRDKHDLLQLYNAVSNTNYTDESNLLITTIDDVVYMGMKNDLSFIIGDTLNLYEHQSTYNPNMPLRGILYFADLYRAYIEEHDLDIYHRHLQELPFPQYIVFYNGTQDMPDRLEQKFSDSFKNTHGQTACLECTAIMLNINSGRNTDLFHKCRRLEEYSIFVRTVRQNLDLNMELEAAVNLAVDMCIQNDILADILTKNRAEVLNLILTEYNEKRHMKTIRDDGYQEGIQSEKLATAQKLLSMNWSIGEVADFTGLSESEVKSLDD
ncbi:RpnC/YadD family protein [Hespellia stercorisuis]|uniref:Putative transposase, YhgA-like n=1 Tax=Hespellia stercorisuis DSM 15480 TaxID=1121950 RepID=A0A1M6U691_9FIRM|nr:hypothetical protein [Hespellia stercorisuis]SHK64598.1 Putative transposase, YhgA-like [Hespellia stercorisuis DSM 15480]